MVEYVGVCPRLTGGQIMTYKVDRIADSVIDLCRKRGIDVTNLKLQKLLYYVQAWHLAQFHGPIFAEEVEAWIHGPVVPSIFRRFKAFRWEPINVALEPVESIEVKAHICGVLNSYGKYSATQLERLTHKESPWLEARMGLDPDEPSQNIISKESMRAYYSKLLNAR
jgi:uncharacterized phage-associated protein